MPQFSHQYPARGPVGSRSAGSAHSRSSGAVLPDDGWSAFGGQEVTLGLTWPLTVMAPAADSSRITPAATSLPMVTVAPAARSTVVWSSWIPPPRVMLPPARPTTKLSPSIVGSCGPLVPMARLVAAVSQTLLLPPSLPVTVTDPRLLTTSSRLGPWSNSFPWTSPVTRTFPSATRRTRAP